MNQKNVIIGNGPAGISALEAIIQNDPQSHVTVLGDEKYFPYSRILIAYYLENRINREQIFIHKHKKIFNQPGLEMKYPARVRMIDSSKKFIKTESEELISYDKLLIASGAFPKIPDGLVIDNPHNVFTVRNLTDVEQIEKEKKNIKHCLFIGGGMISLKLAQALRNNEIKVDIVVSGKHIVSQRLDAQSAEIVSKYLNSKGINVYVHETPVKIMQKSKKKIVLFKSECEIETDMVIIGKGVKANYDFVDQKQVSVGSGVLVNRYLQTSNPNIYAAGDVAEIEDKNYQGIRINPIWPNAVEQGRIAGLNMVGNKIACPENIEMNALHLFDLPIISTGTVAEKEVTDCHVINRCQYDQICFQKFFFRDDRLIGVILIGSNFYNAGILKQLILSGKKIKNKNSFFDNPQNIESYF